MKCLDCNSGCLGVPVSDECIIWTGQSFETLGIVQNKCYKTNIINLALKLETLINENYADLKGLFTGKGSSIVKLPIAVQTLIDYILELKSSNIILDSQLYCLGGNISTCSAAINNKNFNYSLAPSANGITFTYNTLETLNNLPASIESGKFNIQAQGLIENGSVIIVDSNDKVGGFTIPLNRLPAVVSLNCKLGSSCGDIQLYKRILISSPTNKKFNTTFSLNDFSSSNIEGMTQKSFNELLAAEFCKQREEIEALQTMEIPDCKNITYPDNQISSVVSVISSELCDLKDRVTNVGEEMIKTKGCLPNCKENIEESTLQNWINKTDDNLCQTIDLLGVLEQKIVDIVARLNNCCPAGSSGASSGSTSGCPNGNCT